MVRTQKLQTAINKILVTVVVMVNKITVIQSLGWEVIDCSQCYFQLVLPMMPGPRTAVIIDFEPESTVYQI